MSYRSESASHIEGQLILYNDAAKDDFVRTFRHQDGASLKIGPFSIMALASDETDIQAIEIFAEHLEHALDEVVSIVRQQRNEAAQSIGRRYTEGQEESHI